MMKTIAAIAITAGALALGTDVAHADPATDQYLSKLKSDGITWTDRDSVVREGEDICQQLEMGTSTDAIGKALTRVMPETTAIIIIVDAHSALRPQAPI
jgi:Protein of unknown function (DUF732)